MSIYSTITQWYRLHKRDLPWRRDQDPYKIWVSEIMLQQTRIEAVIDYYTRFILAFPNVVALAHAEDETLLKLWQGLGYYTRIRNMKKAALIVCDLYRGVFPTQYEALLKLPGIGRYTAAAIASFSTNAPYVCIDGNVMRVFARLYHYSNNVMEKTSVQYAEDILIKELQEDSSDFNQGMMELGETICLPQNPQCSRCPCQEFCLAHLHQDENILPIREVKKQQKQVIKTVILFQYQSQIALIKRKERLLHNTYEPYCVETILTSEDIQKTWKLQPSQIQKIGEYKHIFTHLIWYMHVYIIHLEDKIEIEGYQYYALKAIKEQYPIATAYLKFMSLIK